MRSIAGRLNYANVVSTLCLFLLLGGGAYAATSLPSNSVGTKQLKRAAVTGVKIKDGTITGAKIDSKTLGIVPAAASADHATTATSANRATSAATADRATSAATADRATDATRADRATVAEDSYLLGGSPASSFLSASQVGFIDEAPSGCTLAVQCANDSLTIGGITFRTICEYSAGIAGLVFRVTGGSRVGYSYVTEGNQARSGYFEGTGNVTIAVETGPEATGSTGTIMVRTPFRVISLNFAATARLPTAGQAACTAHATALAV